MLYAYRNIPEEYCFSDTDTEGGEVLPNGGTFRDVSDIEIQAREAADAERWHNMHDHQRQRFDAKKDNFLKVRAAGPCIRRWRRSRLHTATGGMLRSWGRVLSHSLFLFETCCVNVLRLRMPFGML